ncbi:hypothetical protein [Fodinicola feengrottensis]|uniref:C1q domain-containing protein n=1 Tax=Fodinicola feengrottensis TaxID=435914 RepID=A0ABN2IB79_9ACTN|nr:hypothetical protein [Fodinicola feengrottensis]
MTVGTPVTWTSAQALTAAVLNAELRDQYLALYGIPAARLDNAIIGAPSTSQAVGTLHTTVSTVQTFDTLTYASTYTGSMTTGSAPYDRLIAPVAGTYEVCAGGDWDGSVSVAGYRCILVRQNGTTLVDYDMEQSATTTNMQFAIACSERCSTDIKMAANDYVQLFPTQSSGSTIDMPHNAFIEIVRIGN